MDVALLREKLAAAETTGFTVSTRDVHPGGMATLLDVYLNGALALAPPYGHASDLQLSGKMSLNGKALPARAAFLADATGKVVERLEVEIGLESWIIGCGPIKASAVSAATYLSSPKLILSAGADHTAMPEATLAADFVLPGLDTPARMTALVRRGDVSSRNLVFDGDVGLELPKLSDLAQLAGGFDAAGALVPDVLPLDRLRVSAAAVTIDLQIDAVAEVMLEVSCEAGIVVVADIFEIPRFKVAFARHFPQVSYDVYATFSAAVIACGHEIDVAVTLPDLFVSGSLNPDTPIELAPVLHKVAPGVPLPSDVAISALGIGVGLEDPHPWAFDIELSNIWSIDLPGGGSVDLERLGAAVSGHGATADEVVITSRLDVAGTEIYLQAREGAGTWSFSGGTVGEQYVPLEPLVDELARLAGIDADDVPSAVRSLSLESIRLEFDSGPGADRLKISCGGRLEVGAAAIRTTLDLEVKHAGGTTVAAGGSMSIATATRTIDLGIKLHSSSGGTVIQAIESSSGDPLDVADLLEALGFDLALPEELDLTIQDIGLLYDTGAAASGRMVVFTADSPDYGALLIAALDPAPGSEEEAAYVVAVAPSMAGSLSSIPVIGSAIPGGFDVSVGSIQIVLASAPLSVAQIARLTSQLAGLSQHLPEGGWAFPTEGMDAPVELAATVTIGGTPRRIVLPIGGPSEEKAPPSPPSDASAPPTAPAPAPAVTASSAGADAVQWMNVGKSFGPVSLRRLGFAYSDGEVEILVDAGLALGPASMSLDGFSVRSPLDEFSPRFSLAGIDLAVNSGGVRAEGAFRSADPHAVGGDSWEYSGEVFVTAGTFALRGIGSFGRFEDDPSLFLFIVVDAPLGGPAFFFITGVAGGFGYNRSIKVPTLDALPSFPLVAAATAGDTGTDPFAGKRDDPTAALGVLNEFLPHEPGENWLAVGVKFTSFEMIHSFALVTVSFGRRTEVAVLGLSALALPKGAADPIAYAELALELRFSPDDAVLAIEGQLTPASFVLSKDCHLMGGFAYYTWFADVENGPGAGDFVLTLGGYHPAFAKPDAYPSVRPIGIQWQITSNLSVDGSVYFALVPSAVMAGLRVNATWSSGGISVWFRLYADFLLSWKPFHYQVSVGLSIGASFNIDVGLFSVSFSVHVSASLDVWGPPFAGVATLDLGPIGVTIEFGPRDSSVQPISWTDFRKSFLPPRPADQPSPDGRRLPETYCTVSATAGLLADLTGGPAGDPDWILSPDAFELTTTSVVPCSEAVLETGEAGRETNRTVPIGGELSRGFGVGPVGVADGDLRSRHVIRFNKVAGGKPEYTYSLLEACRFESLESNLPRAPWSKEVSLDLVRSPNVATVNGVPRTIDGLVTGFRITPHVTPPDTTPSPIEVAQLQDSDQGEVSTSWAARPQAAESLDQADAIGRLTETISGDAGVQGRRDAILQALAAAGLGPTTTVDVARLPAEAPVVLLAPPVLCTVGRPEGAAS